MSKEKLLIDLLYIRHKLLNLKDRMDVVLQTGTYQATNVADDVLKVIDECLAGAVVVSESSGVKKGNLE